MVHPVRAGWAKLAVLAVPPAAAAAAAAQQEQATARAMATAAVASLLDPRQTLLGDGSGAPCSTHHYKYHLKVRATALHSLTVCFVFFFFFGGIVLSFLSCQGVCRHQSLLEETVGHARGKAPSRL